MSTDPMRPSEPMSPAGEAVASAEGIAVPVAGGAAAAPVTADVNHAATAVPPTDPSVDQPVAPPAASAIASRRRGATVLVGLRRLLRFAVAVSLFAGGVAIGVEAFRSNQPVPAVVGDPAVAGVPAPPLVQELANGIAADDANAIRATLTPETFARYTAEMERYGISSIDTVETLGTYQDGPRAATELVILGRTVDRNPFAINLIVLTDQGQIVSFR